LLLLCRGVSVNSKVKELVPNSIKIVISFAVIENVEQPYEKHSVKQLSIKIIAVVGVEQ